MISRDRVWDSIPVNRVYIKTYGCQMNERDSEAVAAQLRQRGYSIVGSEGDADVVLLNTCSVRDQAEQKAIGKAGHLRRRQNDPARPILLGIMGCMAQNRGSELLDRLPDLDLIVGTQKFHQIPDHLDHLIAARQALGPKPTTIVDLEEEAGSQNTIREHLDDKPKVAAFVSIMQGCNMNCAYCIVPKTRGQERARPIEQVVAEVEQLAAGGCKDVTLLGQIVNHYGIREFPFIDGKSPFVQLLERVSEVQGIERIRFTSPHPVGFKQDLIDCYGRLPKLCEYVHLPLQSGSDRILKAMRRPYSVDKFRRIVAGLRAVRPDIYLSTDIIVGFPGETAADFEATRALFEEIGFEMGFIFKYSVRSGTPAEAAGDPVPLAEKERRNQELLELLSRQSLRRNEELVGRTVEVLAEAPARRGAGNLTGRTRGFRKVIFPGARHRIGELVPVSINAANAAHLFGDIPAAEQSNSA